MTIETSTINLLLGAVIALQCWIVRQLFNVKHRISLIIAHCSHCQHNTQLDTDRISK